MKTKTIKNEVNFMKGAKPKPAALRDPKESKVSKKDHQKRLDMEKALRGNDPKLRPPKWLSKEGKKEFRRLIKIYKSLPVQILSDLDTTMLAQYCQAYSVYQSAMKKREKLMDQEFSIDSKTDESQIDFEDRIDREQQKLVTRMNSQTKIMNKLSEALCITPVGRARMGIMVTHKTTTDKKVEELRDLKNK